MTHNRARVRVCLRAGLAVLGSSFLLKAQEGKQSNGDDQHTLVAIRRIESEVANASLGRATVGDLKRLLPTAKEIDVRHPGEDITPRLLLAIGDSLVRSSEISSGAVYYQQLEGSYSAARFRKTPFFDPSEENSQRAAEFIRQLSDSYGDVARTRLALCHYLLGQFRKAIQICARLLESRKESNSFSANIPPSGTEDLVAPALSSMADRVAFQIQICCLLRLNEEDRAIAVARQLRDKLPQQVPSVEQVTQAIKAHDPSGIESLIPLIHVLRPTVPPTGGR